MKAKFTDLVNFTGRACRPFDGSKCYISTGCVHNDRIADSEIEIVDYKSKPSRANLEVADGDIIFAKMQGTKKTLMINNGLEKYIYSTGFCAVHPKSNVITNDCLYYLVSSKLFLDAKDKNCSGATQKAITKAGLGQIELNIPSLENQEKIGIILRKLDTIIQLRSLQLRNLDNLIKARFVEMFGDPRFNNKGFEVHNGSELFKFSSGKFLTESRRLKSGIPVYGGNGIAWYTNESMLDTPTIIIGRVGALCGNIHVVTTPVWVTDNAIYIKEFKAQSHTIEFLAEMMKLMNFYQYADFSGQPKITQRPLEALNYLTPPITLQNQFSDFVSQVDKSKFALLKCIDCLSNPAFRTNLCFVIIS